MALVQSVPRGGLTHREPLVYALAVMHGAASAGPGASVCGRQRAPGAWASPAHCLCKAAVKPLLRAGAQPGHSGCSRPYNSTRGNAPGDMLLMQQV